MTKVPRPAFDAPAAEWLVYGDSLQQAGDVRGELVALSHALDEGRTPGTVRDAYVWRHKEALLGPAAEQLARYALHWKFSELASVEIRIGPDDDGPALLRGILEAPTAELLHDITLVGVPDGSRTVDLSPTMEALSEVTRITSLGLVDDRARNAGMLVSRDFDPDAALVTIGPLAPFWHHLEHLRLDVADAHALDLEPIDARPLRSFALRSLRYADWEDAATMRDRLGFAKWPQLESFELRLVETWVANVPNEIDPYVPIYSAENYDGRDDTDDGESEGIDWRTELKPILDGLKACPLERLALTSFQSSNAVLEALEASSLLPAIKVLDLSDSALSEDDVNWMVDKSHLFEDLEQLIVERTSIGEAGAERLRKLGPEIRYSEGNGPRYRYVVGQE